MSQTESKLTNRDEKHLSKVIDQLFSSNVIGRGAEALVTSAEKDDVTAVEKLLSERLVDPNELHGGRAALHAACLNGHVGVVRALLENGAHTETLDGEGDTATHYAARGDEDDVISILHGRGANLDAVNSASRCTALHIAVNKGSLKSVGALLKGKCKVSEKDSDGNTPLHKAIALHNNPLVDMLLSNGAEVSVTNNNGYTVLHVASELGNAEAIRLILPKLLHQAVAAVINYKTNPGFTALHLVAYNNDMEIAELLVNQHGVSLDETTGAGLRSTALHVAVDRVHVQLVRLLVREGCDVNRKNGVGDSSLHVALAGHTRAQLARLRQGEDDDVSRVFTSQGGISAYPDESHASIACFLAQNGADLRVTNVKNLTALDSCPDINLCKTIVKCHKGNRESTTSVVTQEVSALEECMVCSDRKRNVLFRPCNHVTTCSTCSPRVKNCLLCKEAVLNRDIIKECLVCSTREASVLLKPCNHMVTCQSCSKLLTKCIVCRTDVEKVVPISVCYGGVDDTPGVTGGGKSSERDDVGATEEEVTDLKKQLGDLKALTLCPVCRDNVKNVVFGCGHGACNSCSEKIQDECPICRIKVDVRISMY